MADLNPRACALSILNGTGKVSSKGGSFLGQLAVSAYPTLSEKQEKWLTQLAETAGVDLAGNPVASNDDGADQ